MNIDNSQVETLIRSTEIPDKWDFITDLQLSNAFIVEATHEMIMDNPDDVANGVSRVQVVFHRRFFDLFNSLIIKHHIDGSIMLVFNDIVSDGDCILQFYKTLVRLLGPGYYDEERSQSFEDTEKVISLASGRCKDADDLVGHAWIRPQFGFSLSYRTEPLRQFVFSITWSAKKDLDRSPRKNGTLIDLLVHDLNIVVYGQELSAIPTYENGQIKFIDYTFRLDPPELTVFDRVRIRIFGEEKSLTTGQFHVAYYSRFEIGTAEAIALCDRLIKIYRADSQDSMEIEPFEIDTLDARSNWRGRSWWINQNHGIHNSDNPDENVLYWLNLLQSPDEDGFSLHITGFNSLLDYHHKNRN